MNMIIIILPHWREPVSSEVWIS